MMQLGDLFVKSEHPKFKSFNEDELCKAMSLTVFLLNFVNALGSVA